MAKLLEAITIEDADYIGTGKGYDLFDIRSWNAAQQFVIENSRDPAGTAYVHDERTFNGNINDSQRLYFFVQENTNKVYGGVVKSNNTRGNVAFINTDNTKSVEIQANFMFENARDNSNKCFQTRPLPLYLIPQASFDGNSIEGCYIHDHSLKAAIGSLTAETEISLDNIPEDITSIGEKAFTFGLTVTSIYLRDRMENVNAAQLENVRNIKVSFIDPTEKPADWNSNWDNGKDVAYGYGLSDEEIAAQSQAAAERIAAERERQAREEEIKRENARKLAKNIRYKVEGKYITITGTRPTVTQLEIPREIDGKPVTKIAAHAFAYSDLNRIKFPQTLKLIEREAFFGSEDLTGYIHIPRDCVVGKNAFGKTTATIVRD